jgi:N,N-dimethylformamidase beta subunit-like, C-terminal
MTDGREPRRDRREADRMERRKFLRGALLGGAALAAGGTYLAQSEGLFGGGDAGSATAPSTTLAPTAAPTTAPRAARAAADSIYATWVKEENKKPGNPDWGYVPGPASSVIEGYFDTTSANVDDTVKLYVSTNWPEYRVDAYRMGYYGGAGARLVWSSPTLPGKLQPAPSVDPNTHLVSTGWDDPYPIEIGKQFVPGCYVFRLTASGDARFVPLTIRDDSSHAAYLLMNAVTTWQAYNEWGGYSLYWGRGPGGRTFDSRSRIVSYDRPYDANGAPEFLGVELPMVQLVERLGLDVTYATNIDVHRRPERLTRHRALVSLGHDEYYSAPMRDGLESARDEGVNLAFFGANAIYRQIRFEPSALGDERHQVCYKSADEDPMTRTDAAACTVNWRDAPLDRPENRIIGVMYESNPVSADMLITNPGNWVFEGTGFQQGTRLAGVVGGEYDRYYPGEGVPDVEILAHSPLVCNGNASYGDMTYYTAPSGAGVFATGTQTWITNLDQKVLLEPVIDVTTNVLVGLGRGPAAEDHPAQPNT